MIGARAAIDSPRRMLDNAPMTPDNRITETTGAGSRMARIGMWDRQLFKSQVSVGLSVGVGSVPAGLSFNAVSMTVQA